MITTIWRNYKGTIHSDGRILIHKIKTNKNGTENKRFRPKYVRAFDPSDRAKTFKVIVERLRFAQESKNA